MTFWTKIRKLPVVERAALIGGAFVLLAALITTLPGILPVLSVGRGLKLVDITVEDSGVWPRVDFKFRNNGPEPVYISRIRTIVSTVVRLQLPPVHPKEQPVTATYDLALPASPSTVELPISQVIAPGGTDRFDIALGYPAVPFPASPVPHVFVLQFQIVFNEDHAALLTPMVTVFLPPNPRYSAFFDPATKSIGVLGFTYKDLLDRNQGALDGLAVDAGVVATRVRLLVDGSTLPINAPVTGSGDVPECELHLEVTMQIFDHDTTQMASFLRMDSWGSVTLLEGKRQAALRSLQNARAACEGHDRLDDVTYLMAMVSFGVGRFSEAEKAFGSVSSQSDRYETAQREAAFLRSCSYDTPHLEAYREGLAYKEVADVETARRLLARAAESACNPLKTRAQAAIEALTNAR